MKLICTLGASPIPVLIAVKFVCWHHKIQPSQLEIVLVTTVSMRGYAKHTHLVNKLKNLGFKISLQHGADEISQNLEEARQKIAKYIQTEDTIIDITGGTKPMGLGAYQAGRSKNCTIQYFDAETSQMLQLGASLKPTNHAVDFGTIGVTVEEWCTLQGTFSLTSGSSPLWKTINLGETLKRTSIVPEPVLHGQVAFSGSRLQVVLDLPQKSWETLVAETKLGSSKLIRKFAKACQELGGREFVDGYFMVPDSVASNDAAIDCVVQGRALGLFVRAWGTPLTSLANAAAMTASSVVAPSGHTLVNQESANVDFALVTLLGDEVLPSITGLLYHQTLQSSQSIGRIYIVSSKAKHSVTKQLCDYLMVEHPSIPVEVIELTAPSDLADSIDEIGKFTRAKAVGLNITSGKKSMALAALIGLSGNISYGLYVQSNQCQKFEVV
jgi:hypothetical protein